MILKRFYNNQVGLNDSEFLTKMTNTNGSFQKTWRIMQIRILNILLQKKVSRIQYLQEI